jgi:hypothetical protein
VRGTRGERNAAACGHLRTEERVADRRAPIADPF